jgi:hypothetical protein
LIFFAFLLESSADISLDHSLVVLRVLAVLEGLVVPILPADSKCSFGAEEPHMFVILKGSNNFAMVVLDP